MKYLYYLIWKKDRDIKTLSSFGSNKTLSFVPIKFYSDFDDEMEMDLFYVSIPELITETITLPWPGKDGEIEEIPNTFTEYKYLSQPISFPFEEDALLYVYQFLADHNQIPVFEEALNLYNQIPSVYSLESVSQDEVITITKKWKEKEIIIYNSVLEEITRIPIDTYTTDNRFIPDEGIINDYLTTRIMQVEVEGDKEDDPLKFQLLREKQIAESYAWHFKQTTGKEIELEALGWSLTNGADNRPDFMFNNHSCEIKCSDYLVEEFQLHPPNLENYIRYNSSILWVRGYLTSNPLFTIITPDRVRAISNTPLQKRRNKQGTLEEKYIAYSKDYNWVPLQIIETNMKRVIPTFPKGLYTLEQKYQKSFIFKINGSLGYAATYAFDVEYTPRLDRYVMERMKKNEIEIPSNHIAIRFSEESPLSVFYIPEVLNLPNKIGIIFKDEWIKALDELSKITTN